MDFRITFFLFLIGSFPTFSQTSEYEILKNVYTKLAVEGAHEGIPYSAMDNSAFRGNVEGSVFLDEDWKDGLAMTNEEKVYQIQGRFNAKDGEVQILINKEIKALSPEEMKVVSIGEQVFAPYTYSTKEIEKATCFFEIVVEGKIMLLQKYSIDYTAADFHPVLGSVGKDMKVVIKKDLYYAKTDKTALKLKRGKKNVLGVFGRQSSRVQGFARKKDYGYNKKAHLVALFQFHNGVKMRDDL